MKDWEFDNTFSDSEGMVCEVRLSLSTVRKFAKETKLPLNGFVPGQLGYDDMLQLCFRGTQHHNEFQKMTLDEFCDERLYGEAFGAAMTATNNAMVNFTLGQRPLPERLKLVKQMRELRAEAERIQQEQLSAEAKDASEENAGS